MRRFLLSFLLLAAILVGAVFFVAVKQSSPEKPGVATLRIPGKMTFEVEIADNPLAQTLGLSGREQLEDGRGMLFIFPQPQVQKFWMKGMRFPLDIVWINNDRIVGVLYGVEPDNSESPVIYESPEPVDKVLEVNSGEVVKYNIKVGDNIATSD